MPAEGKAMAMKRLNDAFTPRQTSMIAQQFFKNGQAKMTQAFGISSQVPEAARRIIEDSEIKRQHKATLPLEASRRRWKRRSTADWRMPTRPAPEALDAAKEAINSVYAWVSWRDWGSIRPLNTKRLKNSIFTVTGGILQFNGSPVLPPRYGTTEKEFRRMIETADYSQIGGQLGAKEILAHAKLTSIGPAAMRSQSGGYRSS